MFIQNNGTKTQTLMIIILTAMKTSNLTQ
jgi:hypothetical protein